MARVYQNGCRLRYPLRNRRYVSLKPGTARLFHFFNYERRHRHNRADDWASAPRCGTRPRRVRSQIRLQVGRLNQNVEPDMINFRICGLFLAAATLLFATVAEAAVVVAPLESGTSMTKVAQGCGPGGWRGPYGRCHWGYARHCWRGPYGGLHCG